jgi:hypothetical protein
MRNFSTKTEVLRDRRKPRPARVAVTGSLKVQKDAEARKSGSGRKLCETERCGSSQEWRHAEVSGGRRVLKLARVERFGSAGRQRIFETRKSGKYLKFQRTDGVEALRSGCA